MRTCGAAQLRGETVNSLSSFLDMGGYGTFVWPSFGLSAILLVGIFVVSVRSLKANRQTLLNLEQTDLKSTSQRTDSK